MVNQSATRPARVVLEGVPRAGFYDGGERCPEDVPFPSCLRACLEFMGESYGCKHISRAADPTWRGGCTYAYIMGTSGAAFRLSWRPGWHEDNAEIMYMSDNPDAPFRRAFEAVGYAYESVVREEGRDSETTFRSRIVESIRDKRRPVIALGVIGPPESCVVAGYDEGGDVLVGWNYFQGFPEFAAGVEFEPSGYFRKRDWFKDTQGLMIIGEKREKPPLEDVYRGALRWALKVVRTPVVGAYGHERHNGLTAYSAWADALVQDTDFPADDMAMLRQRFLVHDDTVLTVAEGRWYGSLFLVRMAEQMVMVASELLAAASCYAAQHELMWEVWGLVGGIGYSDDHVRKLAEPGVRRQIVPIILHARDKDAEAAEHLERALALAKWQEG